MLPYKQNGAFEHKLFLLLLLSMILLTSACKVESDKQSASTEKYIEIFAVIYKMDVFHERTFLRVRQLDQQMITLDSQGVVAVTENSNVMNRIDGNENKTSLEFLAVGQKIKVFTETLQESIPWVANAVKLEVLSSGTLENEEPILKGINPDLTGKFQGTKKVAMDGKEFTVIAIGSLELQQFPQVSEVNLIQNNQMMIWRLDGTTYHKVTLDSLPVGKQVSVTLMDRLGYPGDTPINGEILEIIFLAD